MPAKTGVKPDGFEMKLVKDLLKHKKRYERYFKEKGPQGEPDHHALSAYTSVIKTAAVIYRQMKSEGKSGEAELKAIARDILENDYGANRN
ncbi:MAG: hypothetical protein M0Z52_05585 [Actinomycetota bacterium]|nr:hypothetical protein [Actinomycetota bacterium]